MGKTTKYNPEEEPTQRDRKRDGWKSDRDASRRRKKIRRGEFVGMRSERAREGV